MKLLKVVIFFLALGGILGAASAQTLKATATGHQVSLTWTASSDSTTGMPGTVSVWRVQGMCPTNLSTGSFTALTSTAPAAGPYTDTSVTVGSWCYYVTATINGATSTPSNAVQVG